MQFGATMVCKIINLPKNCGHACEYIPNNQVIPKLVQEMDGDLWQHTSHKLFMLHIVLIQKHTNLIAATRLPNFTKLGF